MPSQPRPYSSLLTHLPTVAPVCRWLDFWRVEEWKISGMVSVGHDGNSVEMLVSVGHDRRVYPLPHLIKVYKPASAEFLPWTPPRRDVFDALNHCAWALWNDGQARYFRVVYDEGNHMSSRVFEGTNRARTFHPEPATLLGYLTKDEAERATHDNQAGAVYVERLHP